MSHCLDCPAGKYNDQRGLNCTSKEPSFSLFTLSVVTKLNNVLRCFIPPLPCISTHSGQFLVSLLSCFKGFDSRELNHRQLRVILSYFRAIGKGRGHRTSPILLKFGLQSCFRVLSAKMDVKTFQFVLLWKISIWPISRDLGGPSIWRIEGVPVSSILILPS